MQVADPQLVGDPVDTLTGAVTDQKLEFRLTGPIELQWHRHYDSSQSHRSFALGWGHTHAFDRWLRLHADGLRYDAILGQSFDFPLLASNGDEFARHGFTICRLSERRYTVHRHGEPSMAFEFDRSDQAARLKRLYRNGHQIHFFHGSTGQLQGIVDSAGRGIAVAEAADGRLISLTLEGRPGHAPELLIEYSYDERSNLVRTSNAAGHGYSFTYDADRRMVCRTGRKGFRFYYSYDTQGRCIRSMGDDRLYGVALNYIVPGRLTKVTRPDRGIWTYSFDHAGRLTQIQDPIGGIQKFVRDPTGRLTLELDQNQNATRIEYDPAGAPVAKINALGHRVPLPEDPNADDPLVHRVAVNALEYEYGELLSAELIMLPDSEGVAHLGLPRAQSALVFKRSAPADAPRTESHHEAHPLGAMWWPRPERGRVFNHLGKLAKQVDEFGRTRRWKYDASGNVAEYVDFDGGTWTYDTGGWHFLHGRTSPIGAQVRKSYTTAGEVATCTDAGGTLSEYRYDLNDHLTEVRRHGVLRDLYERDAVGNLLTKRASDGRLLLTLQVGGANLPIQRTLSSGDEHSLRYDKSGRCLAAATRKDWVRFAYDSRGHRVLDQRNGLGAEHDYQGGLRLAKSVFFGRFSIHYRWTGNDALTISDPGGKSHDLEFLPHGLVRRHLSNGTGELAQYDTLGRCLFKCANHRNGHLWSRRFHWSGEGELRRVEDSSVGEIRHEYDEAHRLVRRHVTGRMESYDFDVADNLVQQPGLQQIRLRDGNRIESANGDSFAYNDRNHVESRCGPNGVTRYRYDSRDQLTQVATPQGLWEAEYDALGRRTRKTWAGDTTEYYWNTDQLIAEVSPGGRLRLYLYVDALALTPFLFIDYESVDADPASGRCYFVFTDQIGTPCLIEDDEGHHVWRAKVHPFGRLEVSSRADLVFNLRFPGHHMDEETGLHYNRFRYYDPVLGRYLQSDPWGIAGGPNLYAYRSNPLLNVDVRGLGEEGDPKCKEPKPDEEGTQEPGPSKPGKGKDLKDMTPDELRAHVDERAKALKEAFAEAHPEGEQNTTLSVGVVEKKNGDPSTRKVVVTTSDDGQDVPEAVRATMLPGEEVRATEPTLGRGPRRDNPDYNPEGPKDPRNNPKTVTDSVVMDPETGEQKPYTKAKNGEPVEGTQHHAEQRMETGAAANGENVLAQQPTKACCAGCTQVLGDNGGLSKIPNP